MKWSLKQAALPVIVIICILGATVILKQVVFQAQAKEEKKVVTQSESQKMDEAADKMIDYISFFLGEHIEVDEVGMIYSKASVEMNLDRSEWMGTFNTEDETEYMCLIDSTNGDLKKVAKLPASSNKIKDIKKNNYLDKKGDKRLLGLKRYQNIASNYMKSRFPDKKIISVDNLKVTGLWLILPNTIETVTVKGIEREISTGDPDNSLFIISTWVKLSDGSSYIIGSGVNTEDIYQVSYYPVGVDVDINAYAWRQPM